MGEFADDAVAASVDNYWDYTKDEGLYFPIPTQKAYGAFQTTKAPFKKGDIVVLTTPTAHAPQEVMEFRRVPLHQSRSGWDIRCRYIRKYARQPFDELERWRKTDDYKLYDGDPADHDYANKVPGKALGQFKFKHEVNQMAKLYQTIEAEGVAQRFGTYLAKNSTGQLILEMKGENGKVEAFDADKIEEVKPYTIAVTLINKRSNSGEVGLALECTKDRVREGDYLLFVDGSIGLVTKVNTGATIYGAFPENARRLVTEAL